MKLLITGGAGFIGSHLSRKLLAMGHEVTIVDSLVSGSRANIPPGANFVESAIEDYELEGEYDTLYHLASIADYDKYIASPRDTFAANVYGMQKILDYAEEHGSKVYFTSSSEVYGSSIDPMQEGRFNGTDPYSTKAAYIEGKRAAETLCKLSPADTTVFRLFNVYGPGMLDRVIHAFAGWISQGEPVKIYGTGEQVRSFTYISDVLEALTLDLPKGVFNVGRPEPITINALAVAVAAVLKMPLQVDYCPARAHEPFTRIPSIDKISAYSWAPSVDLEHGLKMMLNKQEVE